MEVTRKYPSDVSDKQWRFIEKLLPARKRRDRPPIDRRRIDLPQFASDALQAHRKRMLAEGRIDAPVFCGLEGMYLRKSNFLRRHFHPLLKRAELPQIRFHDLRHTLASAGRSPENR